jgi:hypothetical protein
VGGTSGEHHSTKDPEKSMSKSQVQSLLGEIGKNWKAAASEAKSESSGVPGGTYAARTGMPELRPGSSGLRLYCPYTIVDGEHANSKVIKSDGIGSEENLKHFLRYCARYGYDPEEITAENAEAVLKEIGKKAQVVEIQVKPNGDFTNVYVNKVLDGYDGGSDEEDDDEAPVEIAVGMRVAGKSRGTEFEGEVVEVLSETEVRVKRDDTKTVIKKKIEDLELLDDEDEDEAAADDESDEEEESEEEEESGPQVGQQVSFQFKGKPETGVITEVIEDGTKVKVRKDSDSKVAVVKVESVTVEDAEETDEEEDEEEEEETPEPPKKPRGRPAGSTNKPKTK